MAETAEWDTPFRVGSHHYARSFLEAGDSLLWLSPPVHPVKLVTNLRGAVRSFRTWATAPAGEGTAHPAQYCPLTLLPYRRFPLLDSTAVARGRLRWTAPSLYRRLKRDGWTNVDVLWMTNVEYHPLLEVVRRRVLVYRMYDHIAGFAGIPRSALRLEDDLVRQADVVLCTSRALLDRARALCDTAHYLPNGADTSHFHAPEAEPPEEYLRIPRPRIVFVGLLGEWVDLDLVAFVARKLSDSSFVLIGPSQIDLGAVRRLRNLHVLGPRSYSAVPAYLRHADVGIIPFRANELTHNFNPVKLFEYLASGLPVVGTDLDETRQLGSPALLARDAHEFADAIARSIGTRDRPEYLRFARDNDWRFRFEFVRALVGDKLRAASSRPRTAGGQTGEVD